MRKLGLKGKQRKNDKYHSYKGEVGKIAVCPPSKNGHKIALKNGMNRNNSFTFVEVVAFIPRLACGRPLPIRLKGERTKQPHGQFASAQAYHIGSSLSSDVSTINNKPLLVLYWRQPIKSRLGAHGIVIRFDI